MFSSNTSQVSGGYEIQRSLRFNSADSAYLNRTPASAGNRKTWTLSLWLKRSELGKQSYLFGATSDGYNANFTLCSIAASDQLYLRDFSASAERFYLQTNAVMRDVSAWYHIVVSVDTTQATSSNRVKLYINNVEQSLGTATYPSQNIDTFVDNTNSHTIGVGSSSTTGGYITETNFIDGQALTPSSFGAFDAQTGVWGPTPYGGSYGTNGFYLNFSDNSNTTAATLGKDYSGNSNNWTPNNFSVSAGAGNDSLVDVPTNWGTDTGVGGSVRGNYSTLNPLQNGMTNAPTNGNLQIAGSADIYRSIFNTIGVSSGKWYFEVVITSGSGVTNVAWSSSTSIYQYAGEASTSYGYELENGNKIVGGGVTAYGSALTTNDVFMCAVDMDNLKLFFGKNGTWFASSDPVTGASPAYTFAAGTYFFQMRPYTGSSSVVTTNFGQRPFAYTAPSGFKALNTQNLPTPTIGATTATQAGKFFNPVLYAGDGTSSRAVTGVGFQPDFVWLKARNYALVNGLFDAVRGGNKLLISNLTSAEITNEVNGYLSAFNSDGFTLTAGTTNNDTFNGSASSMVSWNWKANGAGVTNTAGSITSTVSANTTSGFSVVTYTGSGADSSIGHGLGSAPKMIIAKRRDGTGNWMVQHASLGASYYGVLNATDAFSSNGSIWYSTPTSSVFYVGTNVTVNTSGATNVAYCFAEVPGYSKFGSYTGNGSTDGPFVFCGFRPKYLMVKRTDSTGEWGIHDSVRDPSNVVSKVLLAESSGAELDGFVFYDLTANGFKLRNSNANRNASGGTYIFMAFAEAPQKFALAR